MSRAASPLGQYGVPMIYSALPYHTIAPAGNFRPAATRTRLTWQYSEESFLLATVDPHATLMPEKLVPVLEDRLYLMTTEKEPAGGGMHYFSMDKEMRYAPFCDDHGCE